MKIEFLVATTRYTVQSEQKKQIVLDTCKKMRRTYGRPKVAKPGARGPDSNPRYPVFIEGTSTAFYVKAYEAMNEHRTPGPSMFADLSVNPQFFVADQSEIPETMEGTA